MAMIQEKLKQLFQIVEQLETEYADYNRKFTIDGHLIGSIGEVLVAEAFDLKLEDPGKPVIDAETKDGKTVQIKATTTDRVAFSIQAGSKIIPDYVIVIRIEKEGEKRGKPELIYHGLGEIVFEELRKKKLQKNGQIQISLAMLRRLNRLEANRLLKPKEEWQ